MITVLFLLNLNQRIQKAFKPTGTYVHTSPCLLIAERKNNVPRLSTPAILLQSWINLSVRYSQNYSKFYPFQIQDLDVTQTSADIWLYIFCLIYFCLLIVMPIPLKRNPPSESSLGIKFIRSKHNHREWNQATRLKVIRSR